MSPDERQALGDAKADLYTQRALVHETSLVTACRIQFEAQRIQILGALDTSIIGKGYTKKDWLADLINWDEADLAFQESIKPAIFTVLLESGAAAMSEIGRDGSTYDPFTQPLRDYFEERTLKIATDVDAETAKQIRASLSQGVDAGESTFQLRARVEAIMGSASTIRADRIARTEVTRAQSFANIEAWDQSGVVEAKEWFTARDDRVCPFCMALDGKVLALKANYFDKGDSLEVDGKTQKYNYDDVPAAPLHVGCRCVLLPVRK